jgi:hypothetical protein
MDWFGTATASISVALLVTSLVGSLVFVFLEVPFLRVIPVMRMVSLAFTHALLVCFGFGIVLVVIVVLKKWSCYGLDRASADTNAHCYGQNSNKASYVRFHVVETARTWPFGHASRMKPIARFGILQLTKYGHLTRGRQPTSPVYRAPGIGPPGRRYSLHPRTSPYQRRPNKSSPFHRAPEPRRR